MSLRNELSAEQIRQVNAETTRLFIMARKRQALPPRSKWGKWKQKTWGRVARKILKDGKAALVQGRLEIARIEAKKQRAKLAKQYRTERKA